MIARIEAIRYRCFDKLGVELGEFHVLVGANGSGKTTLLDVPVLLGDLLRERTISAAFTEQRDGRAPRAAALRELIFQGQGDTFILAVEAALPERVTRDLLGSMSEKARSREDRRPTHIRYELRVQVFNETELQMQNEYLFVFPEAHTPSRTAADAIAPRMHGEVNLNRNRKFILKREYGGEAEYTPERARRPRSTKSMVSPQQLDRQFGGERPADEVRNEVAQLLSANGWDGRCAAAVIDPELEVLLWQDNANVERALLHRGERLRHLLAQDGRWPDGMTKPPAPKELMQAIIRANRAGPPMVVYSQIARAVSTAGCVHPAFYHVRDVLRAWFPAEDA